MTTARGSYHHGDLHAALVDAGVALAREAGAPAVVLREVTRRAGVTPRAAYRHFADRAALLGAVARVSLAAMARTVEDRLVAAEDGAAALTAVGEGYVRFALDEPGLFEVALFAMDDMAVVDHPEAAGAGGRSPYHQLQDALARLVAEGRLDGAAVEGAALTCWSGVHGYATLAALGPLRSLPRAQRDAGAVAVVARLVGAVVSTGTAPGGERVGPEQRAPEQVGPEHASS
ncbi:TetR/AcrR family transcriptional regulator [Cellulomonas shaoxiangyii]|uniref:TetR/AcrR family transcriptional regulator n=1 Tax=Cellulomonas shaoxiangyii TaxID=2566013 RepID=A0A4P7SIF9_9CELL|nr:TetR/AcrR family transcriptional regulator [Cellulomonas shaoxiangyii]QCB92223.1 TetR/AcrR family transcriptional regulator [Cellulomonas shaoxiangyii]TGY82621.1 TetR/AcrR family transcriptional regulator [Cellulomonas shaoxiangyii]